MAVGRCPSVPLPLATRLPACSGSLPPPPPACCAGSTHAKMSAQLVWELTKNSNAFLRKSKAGSGPTFSAEPGNL